MDIWELIKWLIIINLVLYVFFISFTTTIVYFTYRFWKFLLPKEEHNIFIANAPMVWYKNNTIEKKVEIENLNTLDKKKEIKNEKNNTIISDIFSEKIIYLIFFPLVSIILTILILNNLK